MDDVVLFGNFCVCFTEVFFSWKLVSCTTWLEWNQWFSVKITISKDVFSDTFFLFVSCTSKLEKKHTENLSLGTKKNVYKKNLCKTSINWYNFVWIVLKKFVYFVCLFVFVLLNSSNMEWKDFIHWINTIFEFQILNKFLNIRLFSITFSKYIHEQSDGASYKYSLIYYESIIWKYLFWNMNAMSREFDLTIVVLLRKTIEKNFILWWMR